MMIKIIHAYCGLVALKVLKVTVLIGYRFPFAENHQDHINKHFAACTVHNEIRVGSKGVLNSRSIISLVRNSIWDSVKEHWTSQS